MKGGKAKKEWMDDLAKIERKTTIGQVLKKAMKDSLLEAFLRLYIYVGDPESNRGRIGEKLLTQLGLDKDQ